MKKNAANIILDLFRDDFTNKPFKDFREGDPITPAQSKLPALYASEKQTTFNLGPTGMDEVEHQLILQIVFNKKDEFGRPDQGSSLDSLIYELVQGRDETTNEFMPHTIMGVLRKSYTLNGGFVTIESIGTVKMGIVPRSEDLITSEAHVELTIRELLPVSGRS